MSSGTRGTVGSVRPMDRCAGAAGALPIAAPASISLCCACRGDLRALVDPILWHCRVAPVVKPIDQPVGDLLHPRHHGFDQRCAVVLALCRLLVSSNSKSSHKNFDFFMIMSTFNMNGMHG